MEKLDVYDKKKQKTGKIISRDITSSLEDGEYFLYVKCCIINKDEKLLLTKRRLDKLRGGTWEITGGCVISGETSIEGIARELKEERGLSVNKKELRLVRTVFENRKHRSCIRDIYVLEKDIKLEDLKFKDGEVIDAKFVSLEELVEMKKNKEIRAWINEILEEYKKIINKKRG